MKEFGFKFDAVTQAPNYAIQSSAMVMGRIKQTFGQKRAHEVPLPVVGEVRENLSTKNLVVLLKRLGRHEAEVSSVLKAYKTTGWLVEDLGTGQVYVIRKAELGDETFNEMEAIAWAANQ